MSTPVHELETLDLPQQTRPGEADTPTSEHGTFVNEVPRTHLNVDTSYEPDPDRPPARSPSQAREQAMRLEDDLTLLQAERVASRSTHDENENKKAGSVSRSRSRRIDQIDDFDEATNPLHEKAAIYSPPEHPHTSVSKIVKRIHNSSFIVRYFTYIVPVVALLLIPLLLGALVFPDANVGNVRLLWFSVWLEIVWLTLWAGRIVAKTIPPVVGLLASIFTNNARKWRDLALQLELHATLFFWWLGVEVSFLPTMVSHHVDGNTAVRHWEDVVNKIITSIFVWMVLNLIEKFIIQLIAISFHTRTYADRIEINKFQIGSLTKLYAFSKEKIAMEDEEFEEKTDLSGSGAKTPLQYANRAQKAAKGALNKVGDVAGAVAADFLGRKAHTKSTHPYQVVLTLLQTSSGSQVLARRLYRTFVRDGFETVFSGDLKEAFDNNDEAEAAFAMFDRDMNGDISMEELEAACVEVGRERKAITASLKDLDSVVSKLDDVLSFVVFIISVIVLLSIISASTAGVLTSFGSSILALSWLFSATAQEFLQSVIFVFIKHPFDVGDRVTIYGNTGDLLRGDDYFVKQISLLYTEFKKMQGHVVQAPNSYLNSLFILNQRRSGALAEAVPIKIKYGTTIEQMEALRQRLLEFVRSEKREFQTNILTELREVFENYSLTLNVVFFYKSNWQNEGLRLQRRNKFICMLMTALQEIGIEGPRMNLQGAGVDIPFHINYHGLPTANTTATSGDNGHTPISPLRSAAGDITDQYTTNNNGSNIRSHPSILRKGMNTAAARARGDSLSHKHVDFSLGMRDVASSNVMGDVFEDNGPTSRGIDPVLVRAANREAAARRIQEEEEEEKEEEEEEREAARRTRSGRSSNSRRTTSSSIRFRRVPTATNGAVNGMGDELGSVSATGAGPGQQRLSLNLSASASQDPSQDQDRLSTDSRRSFASSIHNNRFFRHHHHRDSVDADLMEQGRVSESQSRS